MSQNFGTPISDNNKDAREALRLALGLDKNVPFADYVSYIPSQYDPLEIFNAGQQGFWCEPCDISTLYQDASEDTPVRMNNDPIGKFLDKSGNGNHATQAISSKRPTYKKSPPRLSPDGIDDALIVSIPAGGWAGTLFVATNIGTAAYEVTLPEGSYNIGDTKFPRGDIVGVVFRQGGLDDVEISALERYFLSKGAVDSYINQQDFYKTWYSFTELTEMPVIDTSNATDFYNTWIYCRGLTDFPLLDTSKVTRFNETWSGCVSLKSFPLIDTSSAQSLFGTWSACLSLVSFPLINTSNVSGFYRTWASCESLASFPLIDTSKSINFSQCWYGCYELESFPLIDTSKGTKFDHAWRLCKKLASFPMLDLSSGNSFNWCWYGCLSLVEFPLNMFDNAKGSDFDNSFGSTNLNQESIDGILVSLVTSGLASGTRKFGQSGGSEPSAIGKAAIDTLRERGWTVEVTGGY